MRVLRAHFFKLCNPFLTFDTCIPNKIVGSTLHSDLVAPGDFLLAIRSNDVRGASAKDIKKDLDKVQVGKPVFLIFLRAEDSHAFLNPNAEVGKRFFYCHTKIRNFCTKIQTFHLYEKY